MESSRSVTILQSGLTARDHEHHEGWLESSASKKRAIAVSKCWSERLSSLSRATGLWKKSLLACSVLYIKVPVDV